AVQLKISKLKQPETVLRKRLWETPDQFLMDSLSFKKYFPNDAYRNEDEKETWAVERTISEQKITTNENDSDSLKLPPLENGWYLIEASAKDKNGRQLTEKKYVQVFSGSGGGKIKEALAVFPRSQSAEPGQEARVFELTGYEHLHILNRVTTSKGSSV